MSHTRAKVIEDVDKWLTPENVPHLYTQPFISYTWVTSDTNEKYKEAIASHLLSKLEKLDEIKRVTRQKSCLLMCSARNAGRFWSNGVAPIWFYLFFLSKVKGRPKVAQLVLLVI